MVSKAMMVAVAAAVVGIEVTMVRESEVGDVGDQGKVKAITALLRSGKVRSIQPSGASERGADYALRRRANAFFAASRSTRTHQQDQDRGLALGIRHASTSTSTSTPFGARLRYTHCQIVSPQRIVARHGLSPFLRARVGLLCLEVEVALAMSARPALDHTLDTIRDSRQEASACATSTRLDSTNHRRGHSTARPLNYLEPTPSCHMRIRYVQTNDVLRRDVARLTV